MCFCIKYVFFYGGLKSILNQIRLKVGIEIYLHLHPGKQSSFNKNLVNHLK